MSTVTELLLNGAPRQLCIRFPDEDREDITEGIVSGSPKLEQILNSEQDLNFGECNASQFSVEIQGIEDITGARIQVYMLVEGYQAEIPLFNGNVYSAKLQPDHNSREIVAYDDLYSHIDDDVKDFALQLFIDEDVVTVYKFRSELFTYMGISQSSVSLMNDDIVITSMELGEDGSLTFGECIRSICQMNGCFGHISAEGVFQYVFLGPETYDYSANYQASSSSYEEHDTDPIDRIIIYNSAGGIASVYGSGENAWKLAGNVLLQGVLTSALDIAAQRLYQYVHSLVYRPAEIEALLSLPIPLASEIILNTHTGDQISFYVLQQEYSGSQLINQVMKATGSKRRSVTLTKNDTITLINLRLAAAVIDTVREYTVTDSMDEPEESAIWTREPPVRAEGQYIWERTVTTYGNGISETGDPVMITGNAGAAGEDAVLLKVDSSNGFIFKNNTVNTILSVTIFKGSQVITDADTMHSVFGAGSYIQWTWKRLDDERYGVISADDSRIYDGGFKFRLSPEDVDTKVTFQCTLMI